MSATIKMLLGHNNTLKAEFWHSILASKSRVGQALAFTHTHALVHAP